MNACIALIVPALELGGGVPAVAQFLAGVALNAGNDLRVISLASSASDSCSLRISRPATWLRGATSRIGEWEGLRFEHVGTVMSELEFQRYHPRRALLEAVRDCDILQVVCGSPAWANAVVGLGKPVSVQCATRALIERRRRNSGSQTPIAWWRRAMTKMTDGVEIDALRAVDAIQVENPWMLEYARGLNEGRDVDLRYAPPGIDATTLRPPAERTFQRDPYVLCVGRLDDPRKNIGLLLEAYALISAPLRGRARMVLAGQAGPPESFWRRAENLGIRSSIEFIHRPARDELVKLYQQACVFALPSDEEGLGVVLLEAMACGVPVVSTRSGGPEGVISNGEDGFLIPLDNARTMAGAIERLLGDEQLNRAMGIRGRATIERRYADKIAGEAFVDVWEKLLRKVRKA